MLVNSKVQKTLLTVNIKTTEVTGHITERIAHELAQIFSHEYDDGNVIRLFSLPSRNQANKMLFYSGLLPDVVAAMERHGLTVEVDDRRPTVDFDMDYISEKIMAVNKATMQREKPFKLRADQIETIHELLENCHGSVQCATGYGKTIVIAALASIYNRRTLILVDSIELMNQGYEEMLDVLPYGEVGRVGAGIYDPKKFTVGIIDTVINKPEVYKDAEYIIVDEAHMAAARTFRQVILSSNAYIRHGFTGTYTRTMKDEIKILKAVTGPKLFEITCSELIDNGALSRPYITLVKMPKPETNMRFPSNLRGDMAAKARLTRYLIVNNCARNNVACRFAYHHYQKDRKILISVAQIKHGENVKSMLLEDFDCDRGDVVFVSGSSKTKARKAALEKLENGDIRILIATKIFEHGINVPSVDVGINLKGEYTEIGARQTIGRLLRGTTKCWLLDFIDAGHPSLKAYSIHRASIYNSEPAYRVRICSPQELLDSSVKYASASQEIVRKLKSKGRRPRLNIQS